MTATGGNGFTVAGLLLFLLLLWLLLLFLLPFVLLLVLLFGYVIISF